MYADGITLLHLGVVEHSVRRTSGCSFAILQSPRPLWRFEHFAVYIYSSQRKRVHILLSVNAEIARFSGDNLSLENEKLDEIELNKQAFEQKFQNAI